MNFLNKISKAIKEIIDPPYPSPRQIVAWRLYKCDYEDLNDEKK